MKNKHAENIEMLKKALLTKTCDDCISYSTLHGGWKVCSNREKYCKENNYKLHEPRT